MGLYDKTLRKYNDIRHNSFPVQQNVTEFSEHTVVNKLGYFSLQVVYRQKRIPTNDLRTLHFSLFDTVLCCVKAFLINSNPRFTTSFPGLFP